MTVLEIQTPDPRSFDEASRPFAEAVASRYAIKKLIGRGGMGVVYLARDRRLDRLVAIKTLPPHLAADESVKQRFLREIRTAGSMSHPNIVPIHGADDIDSHVFFVMGFVDGDSLATMIRAMGKLPAADVVRILRDVASALSHAHARNIIHRDIKAENILIDRTTGRAMVTDFGIARLAEAAPLTATGQLLGTVYYVSPEQVAGEKIDQRSDIYSLGVVGYFALTGTFPFDAELASAVLIAHVNKTPTPVRTLAPGTPPALAAIIDRCLSKEPGQRFATADSMIAALDQALDGPAPRPRLISDTEARAVWERAAALEASTELRARPAIPGQRDEAADALRTSGIALDDVKQAGREAGLRTAYLDRALVERGLGYGAVTPVRRRIPCSLWAGSPLEIIEEAEVTGEVPPVKFDKLLNILRGGTQQLGDTVASKRELGWRASWFGHSLDASVTPADGKTNVRLVHRMRGKALATFAGTFGIFGGLLGPASAFVSAQIMYMPTPRWFRGTYHALAPYISHREINSISLGIGLAVTLAAFPIARWLVRRQHRQNEARLRLLAEALTAHVQLGVGGDNGEPSPR